MAAVAALGARNENLIRKSDGAQEQLGRSAAGAEQLNVEVSSLRQQKSALLEENLTLKADENRAAAAAHSIQQRLDEAQLALQLRSEALEGCKIELSEFRA